MTFTNFGLRQLGSFMRGDGPSNPQYMEFGTGSSAFDPSSNHLEDGFFRKSISWSSFENRAQGQVTITSVEAVGSNIQEFGIGISSSVGSDLYSRNLSAIGEKNNTFDVDVTFTPIFRRG